MRFTRAVVRLRIPILILTAILLVPSFFSMRSIRVNYDLFTYLPDDMETVIGQVELSEDFNKGAFAFLIFEDLPNREVSRLKREIEAVDCVDTVLWYDSLADLSMPMELLPKEIYQEFNTDHSTAMAVFFETGMSEDGTLNACAEIRKLCDQCYIAGIPALTLDLKELCEREEPIYVALTVASGTVALVILMDGWLIPFVLLTSVGAMILINLGTNFFFGEISFITKCIAAVLQLAVTIDYSVFLWHCYNEQLPKYDDRKEAMAVAIRKTLTSVIGSSVTTVAGFVALCFMSFQLGRDLGLVMAKGVILGVIGSITVLPSLILVLDKPLQKTRHRALIHDTRRFAGKLIRILPVFLIIFALLIGPAYYGYSKAQNEVYYDLSLCLPEDMNYLISAGKLSDDFNIASTHMVLVDAALDGTAVHNMIDEMERVPGVKYVLGLESLIGPRIPQEILPDSITGLLQSDRWELLLINSEYHTASDAVNEQITELNDILKRYDEHGMLIGEAPCMKDMIETTDHDFRVVTFTSIFTIFFIILLVEKSLTLPVLLIAVIELGIFINLGLEHYLGHSMAFITPIDISTIQLGATVDYAILMTTRYKTERVAGSNRKHAVWTALHTSIPSIITSGMSLFFGTLGVALYSDIEIISSICMLMSRGAILSMLLVIFVLPGMLYLFDRPICRTTIGMTKILEPTTVKES